MYIFLSILTICVAHIIRVFRWELLIETYEKPDGVRLTRSLSLGYLLNYFLPFKLGDLGRAVYAGTNMQNGRGFALATVIVERCLDVITVGLMFLVMAIIGIGSGQAVWYYVILAISVAVFLLITLVLKEYIKKLIFWFGGLFNDKYEEKLLRFFWALIWGFKDVVYGLPKLKLILYTTIMWILYLCSYGAFAMHLKADGINRSIVDVFLSLFDQKSLLSSGLSNGFAFNTEALLYAVYMIVPIGIIAVVASIYKKIKCQRIQSIVGTRQNKTGEVANQFENEPSRLNLLPQANVDERRAFLKMYFAGEKKEYIESYLKINRNILVLRDYSAGSNATTILCTDGRESFYRKYAFGDAAKKLADQIEWLTIHKDIVPLADIMRSEINDLACFYDMPYTSNAMTLFDFVQAGSKEKAWECIEEVLSTLENNMYVQNTTSNQQNTELINGYIEKKVIKNLDCILNSKALGELLKYKTIYVNGNEYKNLSEYMDLFDVDKLKEIFANDTISDIHGDLTIENIVYTKDSFYLIDPNTGNIFNSKFIDYAKLLQSLHGKYEFLMAVQDVVVDGNHVDFKFVVSDAYDYLYNQYCDYLEAHFSEEEIKSIYYHEVVNWLRLMPYKLTKGRGELFYAGLLMIVNDIADR